MIGLISTSGKCCGPLYVTVLSPFASAHFYSASVHDGWFCVQRGRAYWSVSTVRLDFVFYCTLGAQSLLVVFHEAAPT